MECLLKGVIEVTDNIEYAQKAAFTPNSPARVVMFCDETSSKLPLDHPKVIGGSILLPPMEALIAEADGDAVGYDYCYRQYLSNEPSVVAFISAIVIYLYKGGYMLFYCDNLLGNHIVKFLKVIYDNLGIRFGVVGNQPSPPMYDVRFTAKWLEVLYMENQIPVEEYMRLVSENTQIPDYLSNKLLQEVRPYGQDLNEQYQTLSRLIHRYKENPKIIVPIHVNW
mgnify:FL=1